MAQTAVDVVVRVKDLAALDRLKKSLAGVEGATLKGERSIKRFEGSLSKLSRTLAGLALGDQLRRAFGAAAELSGTEQRINNVTKKYSQFIGIQNVATQAAKTFAVSQQQALSDFSSLAARLGSTGASLKDLENIYGGFNTILLENQVSAQEAASAQLQLNQALGSGRLAGEEFRAIAETTPQLLDEVAKVTGVARGELKQFAADGGITSRVLIQALTNIKTQGADALAASLDTPAGKLRQFDAAVKDFQVTVGQELLPVITPFIVEMTKLLKAFGELPAPVKTAVVGLTALLAAAALLGPALGAIAGGAKALGAGLLALGAGGSTAAGALSLTTKALLVLKGAMLALPWVAVAAGLGLLVVETVKYINKKKELNQLMNASITMSDNLEGAQSKLKTEIERTRNEIENYNNKVEQQIGKGKRGAAQAEAYRKKIEELTKQLQLMEGEYNVVIRIQEIRERFGIDPNESGVKNGRTRGRQGSINRKKAEAARLAALNTPPVSTGSSGGGGGGGGAARESQVPQLQRELDLSNKLLENDRQRLEAQFNRNTAIVEKLAQDRIGIELAGKKAEIEAEDIPSAEKKIKLALAENEAKLQTLELNNQIAEAERQRVLAVQGVLAPLEQEIELLQAKLNGNEEEIRQLQQIEALAKSIAEAKRGAGAIPTAAEQGQASGLVQQRDELKAQVEEFEKMEGMVKQVSGTIASEFTSAVTSVIDGSKSVEEAFSDMLQNIGKAFIDMAMQIIQQQIQMIIYGMIMKALGISTGGGLGGSSPISMFNSAPSGFSSVAPVSNIPFSAGGLGYADGGRPKVGDVSIVGERGPELFVPDQPGRVMSHEASRAAMAQYSPSNESVQMAPVSNSYNFSTIRIADEEYVSREQLTKAMNEAAFNGAKQGEQRAMNRLRQSRSTRSKIGI